MILEQIKGPEELKQLSSRDPGILMSTLAADGLMEGDIMRSVLLFLVAAGIAALAIVFHEKIMHAFAKKK